MEAVCVHGDGTCQVHALAAALHTLSLYCAAISTALICCCSSRRPRWQGSRWRGQNVRGIASLALGVVWCCGAAAASLRPANTVRLVAALMAPLAWLAAAALHVSLWSRRLTAPILYLVIYWLLSSTVSGTIVYRFLLTGASSNHVEIYIHGVGTFLAFIISVVDCLCFYDEVARRPQSWPKSAAGDFDKTLYKYTQTHFYSKITFFWLNPLLYKGFWSPLEKDDLGDIPKSEHASTYFDKLKVVLNNENMLSLWHGYMRMVWPNFYIAGILKLCSDLISVVPALGLAIIIQFVNDPVLNNNLESEVTIQELLSNGYTMLVIVTLALIVQALLSQNSTHLVTVEGTRLKMALQSTIYDKCTRLSLWSTDSEASEKSPLMKQEGEASIQSGLLTNLVSQDTYNIMSCIWIFHYTWAIPIKVIFILYLLYTKLGISAIIGTIICFWIITPLQLYIGKKISDNSRDILKCTDHRISKISEILEGLNVIKLYVWEDVFNEKILQLREVELKMLNKDSAYWGILNFTTHVSSILVAVVTFTLHYYFGNNTMSLNAVNIFAGLALFNQLTVPFLILPVTILMFIQAMVSTKRIKDFLELPESYNDADKDKNCIKISNEQNETDDVHNVSPEANPLTEYDEVDVDIEDKLFDENCKKSTHRNQDQYLIKFENTAFSWKMKDYQSFWLEIDDLDIPAGKLIMVVGASGSGKSSLLSAIIGEMYNEKGDVTISRHCQMWYCGQPPWLLQGTIKDNIVMGNMWCPQKYARVLRATGLRPDLQILPDGDNTFLGNYGTPLSGGQRVRLCIARALYSRARLIVLDEPFGALDVILAEHVVSRALLPAVRSGRTVVLATNRLELIHYADMIIAMEDGRVSGVGRLNKVCNGVISEWAQLAAEARATAGRAGAGPPGGSTRERLQLLRTISRKEFERQMSDDTLINEVIGAHLLTEVPMCTAGTWRRKAKQMGLSFSRQVSSPPSLVQRLKWSREVRRAVSADATNEMLQQEASLLRRFLSGRPYRTLSRWTDRTLQRLLSVNSEFSNEVQTNGVAIESAPDATFTSIASNGIETSAAPDSNFLTTANKEVTEPVLSECTIWWQYSRACGWWGVVYLVCAATAQAITLTGDYWLSLLATKNSQQPLSYEQMWGMLRTYALWSAGGLCVAGCAQAACACAGAFSRRILHERLLHATLHAPIDHHNTHAVGDTLHRFSSDTSVIDKKLPTAINRWAQLGFLCIAAIVVNVLASPWTLLAMIPVIVSYIVLQSIYLRNARELQHMEAESAARAVSLAAQTLAGAATVRAGRLRAHMLSAFCHRLDDNHYALLLLNSANRWLSLTLDMVGAASVCVSLAAALSGGGGALAGLAGAYSLLLPVYLAHLAKCRADLDLQLSALQRILNNTDIPQEDYKEDCPIPKDWQRNGEIEFQNVSIQHQENAAPVLKNINFTIKSGQKVAICGRSGSGKSTLLLSCVGATYFHKGRLLVDGHDIAHVPLRALRHRVVVLPQEAFMFSGTLRENLDPLAVHTDEEIFRCLRAVGLYDYVTAQSAGLECGVSGWCGEWGGGRGARLCAARAALHAQFAAALLLDEPGAALDASAERALLHAFSAVAPNTTIVTVAHRVASVRGYDSVVVLEEGAVAERGDLDALLNAPTSRLSCALAAANTRQRQL